MRATRLLDEHVTPGEGAFARLVVRRLNRPVEGCNQRFGYPRAYGTLGNGAARCAHVVGGGDHRPVGKREWPYKFTSLDKLKADFGADEAPGKEVTVATVTIGVGTSVHVQQRHAGAFSGRSQGGPRLTLASHAVMRRVLTPNRRAARETITDAGPLALREIARRVSRDVKGVHTDVHALLCAEVLNRTESEAFEFTYEAVHVGFTLRAAAHLSCERKQYSARTCQSLARQRRKRIGHERRARAAGSS